MTLRTRSGRLLEPLTPSLFQFHTETETVVLEGPLPADLAPGDLAHLTTDGDRIVSGERVHRPTRSPFSPGSETRRFTLDGLAARLRLRTKALAAVREVFSARDVLEVETPALVPSPGLDVHVHAFDVFDAERRPLGQLVTSPEYAMKRMLVGGTLRCFQLARCFRAEELGRRHQPEFTMIEWYRAWSTLDAVLDDTEALARAVFSAVGAPALPPFERLTVRQAFALHAPELGDPVALADRDEEAYFAAISDRIEPALGRDRPTFLTRFPARHASLSRLCDDDPTVCERAELYLRGVELCNAFYELTDPVEQRRRFERDLAERTARALPRYAIDEAFLGALEEGLPPCAGNALGFDRLFALALGLDDIADTLSFPRRM